MCCVVLCGAQVSGSTGFDRTSIEFHGSAEGSSGAQGAEHQPDLIHILHHRGTAQGSAT